MYRRFPEYAVSSSTTVGWLLIAVSATTRIALGSGPIGVTEVGEIGQNWRRTEYGGLQCLFLQLRVLGYDKPFERFWKDDVPVGSRLMDLASLAARAEDLGFSLAAVRLTMKELQNLRSPVIVHLEHAGLDTGSFALVTRFTGDDVLVVPGGTAALQPIPIDTFRRQWSSFALVPVDESRPILVRETAALLLALWAVVSVAMKVANKTKRQRNNKC